MEDGVHTASATGTPQGGVISPLLSNIYGHALDALWEKEAGHLGHLIRYADDGVILCRSGESADQAYQWLQKRARSLHLQIHPEKTRVRWPSRRTMAAVRAKVKAITAPRSRLKWPIGTVVAELNPVLRGWSNYSRWGNSVKRFSQIDNYVHERLALCDSKKRQRSGRCWSRHSYAWYRSLGVIQLTGTIQRGAPARAVS
jgi:RNA-directed DNA polymerase